MSWPQLPAGTTEHPINKTKQQKILVSIWDFGAVPPQSERSHYVCNRHPAKMRPSLTRAILQIYGESPVLDPMAGVGTTLVEAMLLGMDAVGVEYEEKFVEQANENICHAARLSFTKNLGKAVCIKGDARKLSCLNIQGVSSVVFSPPYFNAIESVSPGSQDPEGGHLERQHRLAREGKSGYGSKHNIGHLRNYGFGSVVFSPPYCGVMDAKRHVGGISARDPSLAETGSYSKNEKNIGNIQHFGSIIFSPPYMTSKPFNDLDFVLTGKGKKATVGETQPSAVHYDAEDNIGNISNYSQFNSVLFSPPFGEQHGKGGSIFNADGTVTSKFRGKFAKSTIRRKGFLDASCRDNIDNVPHGRTYLGEMLKVYSECYRVLGSNKYMVVVVRDIRRKGLTIPLGADTIKLCQLAGFELFDIIISKTHFPSFWVLDRAKKDHAKGIMHPLRNHEYVLVFKKPKERGAHG